MSDLLDDDHLGGLLARIRTIGGLIGVAANTADPVQISTAGWLVEELADKAHARLRDAVRRPSGKNSRASRQAARRSEKLR